MSARCGLKDINDALSKIIFNGTNYLEYKNLTFEKAIDEKIKLIEGRKRGEK